jgi:predicted dehydrogenase
MVKSELSFVMAQDAKVAMVGCGAVAECRHLPALVQTKGCEVVALVDCDRARAEKLAKQYSVRAVLTDYRDLHGLDVDIAIVALPNYLHAPISIELLSAGIHVLVEKPMALSVAECDRMLQAAQDGRAVLAVAAPRCFLYASRFAKWAIDSGLLGRLISVDMQDGVVFQWPLASDFFFRKETAGGGVLIDNGSHAVSHLLCWLGKVRSFEYYDDSCGGVEAECKLFLEFRSGATATIELSRLRNLRNTTIVRGERGELEVGLWTNSISLRLAGSDVVIHGQGALGDRPLVSEQTQIDLVAAEHEDFLTAIKTGRQPVGFGVEAKGAIALIEACYKTRRPLVHPWDETIVEPTRAMAYGA